MEFIRNVDDSFQHHMQFPAVIWTSCNIYNKAKTYSTNWCFSGPYIEHVRQAARCRQFKYDQGRKLTREAVVVVICWACDASGLTVPPSRRFNLAYEL